MHEVKVMNNLGCMYSSTHNGNQCQFQTNPSTLQTLKDTCCILRYNSIGCIPTAFLNSKTIKQRVTYYRAVNLFMYVVTLPNFRLWQLCTCQSGLTQEMEFYNFLNSTKVEKTKMNNLLCTLKKLSEVHNYKNVDSVKTKIYQKPEDIGTVEGRINLYKFGIMCRGQFPVLQIQAFKLSKCLLRYINIRKVNSNASCQLLMS